MTKKIAMLFPYAPKYREPIYQLMDNELNVDWFFCGNAKRDLKLLDYALLKKVNLSMQEVNLFGPFTKYKGLNELHLESYDVLIIAGVYQNFTEWMIALKYGRCRKKPALYFWTHGWYGKESKIRSLFKKFLYHSGQGVFVYGNYARDLMIKNGFDPNTVYVIHNSLDYETQLKLRNSIKASDIYKNYFGNDDPVLIFLGRLTKVKQLDMVVRAVAHLEELGEKYNLVLVGDGTEKDSLETLTKQYNIEKRVWFYGACYDESKNAELVYNADLCIAPGNIGLTAMHVLMFGCPAITHDCFKWQMPEFESIKPNRTGNFFKYKYQESLEETISDWFVQNGNRRDDIRKCCYTEIDTQWTPKFQIEVLKKALDI